MSEPTREQIERLRKLADEQIDEHARTPGGDWDLLSDATAIRALLDAYEERGREVTRLVAGQSCMLDDLAALLRALGLGDHARPETPHYVMLSAIAEIERLRAALAEAQAYREAHFKAWKQAEARLREVEAALTAAAMSMETIAATALDRGDEYIGTKAQVRGYAASRARVARAALAAAQPEESKGSQVIDLMEVLKESLRKRAAAQPEEVREVHEETTLTYRRAHSPRCSGWSGIVMKPGECDCGAAAQPEEESRG